MTDMRALSALATCNGAHIGHLNGIGYAESAVSSDVAVSLIT